MTRKYQLVAVIAGAGILLAVVLWLTGANPWFHLGVPLATLVLVACVGVAACILLVDLLRTRSARRVDAAVARVHDEERSSYRRFLRRLDHEIKNPVTAIRSALAAAASDPSALDVAGTQAARLSRLVTELAKLADLETRTIERGSVDLEDIAREAVDAVAAVHPDRAVRVEFARVPWPVPPVSGDADLLLVAVYNLVANAAKYSDPGAHIEIRGTESDGFVTLEVSDTGWGIPAEDIALAWDELARGSNTRGKEGSGLGLSIVRIVVERHGGTVSLRSAPGQGTRVAVRLPVA